MKLRPTFLLTALFLSLFGCNRSVDPVTPPGKDDPDPPVESTLDVTLRSSGEVVSALELDFAAYSDVFIVKSNTSWTVEADDSWITVSRKESGISVYFTVGVNTTGEERCTKVLFRTADGKLCREVKLSQKGSDLIGRVDFSDMMLAMTDLNDKIWSGYLATTMDGKKEWLFDAFCLVPKNSEDLSKWLEKIDRAIGSLKPEIEGPYIPRRIVISITTDSSSDREDRVNEAIRFIDETLVDYASACRKGKYSNLRLIGFYWQEENGNILPTWSSMIASYLHEKNLAYYWIPYFNAFNYAQWKNYGFDMAWLQPNYLFDDSLDKSRLYDACSIASARGMGLEVEWDNNKPIGRHADYWDVYEELGILDNQTLTYYDSGSQIALLDIVVGEEVKAFYSRAAADIVARQKRFYDYE